MTTPPWTSTGSGNYLAGVLGLAYPLEVAISGTEDFLLVDPLSPGGELLLVSPGFGAGVVTFTVPIPHDPVLAGFPLATQGGGLGGSTETTLHNACDLVVGF